MDARILAALDLREGLLNPKVTNACRVADGEGDGMPGVYIDVLDGVWLVSTVGRKLPTILSEELPCGCRSIYWKRLDQHDKRAPQWVLGDRVEEPFAILENDLRYEMSMQAGYSQGLFLDQRGNRQRVRDRVAQDDRVLNCFSYTCGFSVAAAVGGAVSTSLDLSSPYLEWGKRNFELNGLPVDQHYFCKGDALHWLKRFAKQGRRFDGVVLDPPTFSRSAEGVFRVGKDYDRLVSLACQVSEREAWLLCCCNERRLSLDAFLDSVGRGISASGRHGVSMDVCEMPSDFTGEDYLKSVWIELQD